MTTDPGEEFGIATAAQKAGLTQHTLRYYERVGLLTAPRRGTDRRRRYTERDMEWIQLITRLRSTGMPVATMLRYAELARQGSDTFAERRALLTGHRDAVRRRIAELSDDLAVIDLKIDVYLAAECGEVPVPPLPPVLAAARPSE
jgi:DNA-binding transcriptional MerR regulator